MSKMTIKQRIAVLAIAALGGSLLSVTTATTANAAAAAMGAITQNGTSTGIVTAYNNAASTVTMTADGVFVIDVASNTSAFGVSGGKITGYNSAGTTVPGTTNGVVITADGTGAAWSELLVAGLQFKPEKAGSNMVIKMYGPAAAAATTPVTAAAAAAAGNVLRQTITVTVVPTGASGAYSAGNSWISIQALASTPATVADVPKEDFSRGNDIRINYTLVDGLGTAGTANMPANTTVMAQVTSGTCIVGTTAGVYTLPVISESGNSGDFFVTNSSDPVAATKCTVAISVNGVVASTKNLTFAGPASVIKVSSGFTALTSNASVTAPAGKGYVTVEDSAGNVLGGVTVTADTTTYSGIISAASIASNLTGSQQNSVAASTLGASLAVTCTSTGGSSTIKLRTTLSNGTVIRSADVPINCAGGANSYTASLDKANYVPGDIATLTITAKDSKDRLTHDAAAVGAGLTTNIAISGSNMTAVTAPSSGDTFDKGVKTYKFIVGATVGSYNMVVDLPSITSVSTVGQTSLTLAYKITASTTEVSNADVLKSIVALIASINKQIQALQKLILARR